MKNPVKTRDWPYLIKSAVGVVTFLLINTSRSKSQALHFVRPQVGNILFKAVINQKTLLESRVDINCNVFKKPGCTAKK